MLSGIPLLLYSLFQIAKQKIFLFKKKNFGPSLRIKFVIKTLVFYRIVG